MAKRLVFSRKAYADIDNIIEFNNNRNKSDTYSKKFIRNLNGKLKILIKQPFIGRSTDIPNILLLIWDKYYIFYSISEHVIEITSVYHQRENAPL
jgi:plasmid stabilization system protein ParE